MPLTEWRNRMKKCSEQLSNIQNYVQYKREFPGSILFFVKIYVYKLFNFFSIHPGLSGGQGSIFLPLKLMRLL